MSLCDMQIVQVNCGLHGKRTPVLHHLVDRSVCHSLDDPLASHRRQTDLRKDALSSEVLSFTSAHARVRTFGSCGTTQQWRSRGRSRSGGWESCTESRPHCGAFSRRGPWFRRQLPCILMVSWAMVVRPSLASVLVAEPANGEDLAPAPAPASEDVPPHLNWRYHL